MRQRFPSRSNRFLFNNTRPHVGGEAMSEKAERPLKDAIKATFVEVPRNGMASVGPWMARVKAAPKKGGQGAEFPSKFPSGVDRETENPAASTADDKAASYATLRYSRAR